MAINPQNLMHQLSPLKALDFGGAADASMRRQQLEIMRARLQEEKRANREQEKIRRESEAGEMARARMQSEREAARAEAQTAAKLSENRLAAQEKFVTTASAGDLEGAEALIPVMNTLGSGVDITRRPGALPSYRIHTDAAADAKTEAAEAERNWENAVRPIYRDAYGTTEENPLPQIAPVTPTGTALDMQALAEQRGGRLGPAFQDLVKAFPYDYRDSAAAASAGVQKLNLPPEKAAQEFRSQLSGPIDLIQSQLEAEAQKGMRDEPTEAQKTTMRKAGSEGLRKTYADQGVGAAVNTLDLADRVITALSDPNPAVQSQAGQLLVQLGQVKGVPSDKELGLALGDEKLSMFDKAGAFIQQQVFGGFGLKQRDGLIRWAKMQKGKEQERLNKWLDSADRMAAGKSNPYEREGVIEYRNSLPQQVLDSYEEWRKSQPARKTTKGDEALSSAALDRGELEDELILQAGDAGLDPEPMLALMSGESGGNTSAKNARSSASGLFQFTDETTKEYGLRSAKEYASLPAEEQVRLAVQLFKDRGVTESSPPEDYVLAIAAPKFIGEPGSTIVYPKGTKEHADNAPWQPPGGGDITVDSIVAYYRSHGLGGGNESTLGVTGLAPQKRIVPKSAIDKAALELMGLD